MNTISRILCTGPGNVISEYDGGRSYMYLGTLSKSIRRSWDLPKETNVQSASSSRERLQELPDGTFRIKCLILSMVTSIESADFDQVQWILPRLPSDCRLYSDNLLGYVLETGVVSAIKYVMSCSEPKKARGIFRKAAISMVHRGHHEALKFLFDSFGSDKSLRMDVAVAASREGDMTAIRMCATSGIYEWPPDGTKSVLYRGDMKALGYIRSLGLLRDNVLFSSDVLLTFAALGGHIETLGYMLDNITFVPDGKSICMMICRKGNLEVVKYLIEERGLSFNKSDCLRFSKNGSDVAIWIENCV